MKKYMLLLLSFLLINGQLLAQESIENPAIPLNRNAGRTLELETEYEIRDDSGEFYFRWPTKFCLDSQGCLYILDEDQLLQFSPEGKFIKNLYKKGQGPGEISSRFQMVSYFISDDKLYIYDGVAKIITMDREGNLVKEIKQTAGRFFELLGLSEEGFYLRYQTPVPRGNPGFKEIENQIHLVSFDGSSSEKIIGSTSRVYSGPSFGMDWDKYMHRFSQNDGSLYVSHSCEYKIIRSDLAARKKVISFNRDYPRVKYVMPDHLKSFYKKYDPPKKKFENDVSGLFLCNDNLWVQTSTSDNKKGILFDVFDSQGRYVDNFYLKLNGNLMLTDGDHIYVTERDEEENISIKKYVILNAK
jgi:hypothetical protein